MILNRDIDGNREPGALTTDPHVMEHKDIQTAVNATTGAVADHSTKISANVAAISGLTTQQAALVQQINALAGTVGSRLITICTSVTRPSVNTVGAMCYETDTLKVSAWTGTAWVGINAGLADVAASLQVDAKKMPFHWQEKGVVGANGSVTPTLPTFLWGSSDGVANYIWNTDKLKVGFAGIADSATVGGVQRFSNSAARDVAYYAGKIQPGQSIYLDSVDETQVLAYDPLTNVAEWRRNSGINGGTATWYRTPAANNNKTGGPLMQPMLSGESRYRYQIVNNRLEANVLLVAERTQSTYARDWGDQLRMVPPLRPSSDFSNKFGSEPSTWVGDLNTEVAIGTWCAFDIHSFTMQGTVYWIPNYNRIYFAYDYNGQQLFGRRWLSWSQYKTYGQHNWADAMPRLTATFSYPVEGTFVVAPGVANPRDSLNLTAGSQITANVTGYDQSLLQNKLTVSGTSGAPVNKTYSTAGQTIRDTEFYGQVTVSAANVTFKNCIFHGRNATTYEGLVNCATSGVSNAVFEDCTFDPDSPSEFLSGIIGTDYTLRRCDIMNVVDGAVVYNTFRTAPYASKVVIEKSYIHGLAYLTPEAANTVDNQTHNDAISIQGGTGTIVRINNIQTYYGDAGTDMPTVNGTPTPSGAAQPSLRAITLSTARADTSGVSITDNQIGGALIPIDCTLGTTAASPGVGTIWRNSFDGGSLIVAGAAPQTILLKGTQTANTGDGTTNKNTFYKGTYQGQEVTVRRNG